MANDNENKKEPRPWPAIVIVFLVLIIAGGLAIRAGETHVGTNEVYLGAALFGGVIGWVTYRTLRRTGDAVALSDIAAVISAVGGATVTGIFTGKDVLSWYFVGLFFGFFVFYLVALFVGDGKTEMLMGKNKDTQ